MYLIRYNSSGEIYTVSGFEQPFWAHIYLINQLENAYGERWEPGNCGLYIPYDATHAEVVTKTLEYLERCRDGLESTWPMYFERRVNGFAVGEVNEIKPYNNIQYLTEVYEALSYKYQTLRYQDEEPPFPLGDIR